MIIDGEIIVFKKGNTDMKTLAIADVRDGILDIVKRHSWNMDYIQVSALAKMFVGIFYSQFQTKQNGNLVYPLRTLESWMIERRPRPDDSDY